MSQNTYKKFGFWSALAMVIGSVVGIGIFFKNESIFAATQGNGVATLLAWVFGGLISLMCALSFAEISKSSTNTSGGLGEYAKVFIGKRFSNFVKTNYAILYFGLLAPALAYFTYIFLTIALNVSVTNMGIFIAIVAGPLLSFVVTLFFPGVQKATFTVSVFIKFVPLLLAALSGIWFTKNGGGINTNVNSEYVTETIKKFATYTAATQTTPGAIWVQAPSLADYTGFTSPGWYTIVIKDIITYTPEKKDTLSGMLAAMPMVLFAYDSFINVGSIAKDTKNAEKNIPLAIGAGMIFVSLLYTLITISQLMQNQGTVSGSIASALGTPALSSVINFAIVISACGTTLSVVTAGTYITSDFIESDTMAFSKAYSKKYKSAEHAGASLYALISFIFGLTFFIVNISVGKGDMLDEMSNYPTLFFYVIYAVLMIAIAIYKIKNSKGKAKGHNIYLITISIIGTLGIAMIVSYQFYALIDEMVSNGFKANLIKNVSLILYTVMFLTFPFINAFIKNKFEHKLGTKDALFNTLLVDLEGKKLLKSEPKVKKVKVKKEKAPKPAKVKKTKKKK